MSDDVLTQRRAGLPAHIPHQPHDKENDIMVDTFGFRPRGYYGMLAPFGFGPPGQQGLAASAGGSGQGGDVADVIPVGDRSPFRFCQNVGCGAHTGGATYPLCQDCNRRLQLGDGPFQLENGTIIRIPIVPGLTNK